MGGFAALFHQDLSNLDHLLQRCLVATPSALLAVLGMVFWAYTVYSVCLMHIFACVGVGIVLAVLETIPSESR